MSKDVLVVPTCPQRWTRTLVWLGGTLAVSGGIVFAVGGASLETLVGKVGLATIATAAFLLLFRQVARLRCPAVIFDASSRMIRARGKAHDIAGAAGSRELGRFEDFKGVDLEAHVQASALQKGALHEVHKTYPDAGLMTYELVLVGAERRVPLLREPHKPRARELQTEIVRHCGFGYSGSVVPDANRELPQ